MASTIAYAYDLDGTNPDNRIPNEVQYVVPPSKITDTSVIVPRCAPFHGDSLIVNTGSINNPVPLTEGVDYFLVYKFIRASRSTGHQMYGGIMFTNRSFNGNVWLTYQTVGGDCVLDDYTVVEQWSRSLRNVRYISWDQLAGLPSGFPVADHVIGGDTLIGLGSLADGLNAIAASITDVNSTGTTDASAGLAAHIQSTHAHTASAVGLGSVNDWPVATTNDFNVGTVNAYANAAGVKAYVAALLATINTNSGALSDEVTALQGISDNLVGDVDQLQTTQTTIGNAVTTLQSQMSAVQQNQTNVVATVSSGMTQISSMQTQLGSVQSQLDTTTGIANSNSTALATVETTQSQQASSITTLQTNQTGLQNAVSAIQTAQTADEAAITALQNSAPATSGQISTLTTQLGSVTSTANTAQALSTSNATAIAAIETNQTTDEANIVALQSTTGTLVTNMTTAQGNITTLNTSMTTANSNITATSTALSTLATTLGSTTATANTAAALAATNATEIATAQGEISTLQTTTSGLQSDVTALNAITKPFKLAGTFYKGTFLFRLLPNEKKDFTVVTPGGDGGQFASSPFAFKLISTGPAKNAVLLNRLSATADGTTLAAGTAVLLSNGGQGGTYGYNDGSDHAGTGGQGGTITLTSGEVNTGYATTAGAAGTDGTNGDTAAVAGAAGYTVGGSTYGQGVDGIAKSGGGGSGTKATFTIQNTTTFQLWYELQLDLGIGLSANQGGVCIIVHHDAP